MLSTRSALLLSCASLAFAPPRASAAIEEQNIPEAPSEPEPAPQPVLTRAPELVEFVGAAYPPNLLIRGVGGEVVMLIDIDAAGSVERVEVVSASRPELAGPAMSAVTQFVFSPAEIDGEPSAIRIEYRYVFTPEAIEPDAIAGEPTQLAEHRGAVNFSGQVLEAGVRTPLRGAVIRIAGRPVAETDGDGRFAVRGAPIGTFEVSVSAPSHDPYRVDETINPSEALETRYYLVRTSNDPYETVVRTRVERKEVARVQLERKELEKVPGTFGDPVRVIENLPGLARTPGGLGGALLVRGANPTDTAVYIDGVEIPIIYHFGGLTSVVAAGFLEKIDFYPGGFPARYGHAVAGVVDVGTRDLDCEMLRGYGKADFIDAAAYTCAPVADWKVAAAARRSYIDVLLPPVLDAATKDEDDGAATISPVYWDYQLKAQRTKGDHAISVFAFGSDDTLKAIQTGSAENINFNFGLHLSFHRILLEHRVRLSDRLTLLSVFSPGVIGQSFEATADEIDLENSFDVDVYGISWREELSLKLRDDLTLNGGIDTRIGWADLDAQFAAPTEITSPFPAPTFDFTDSQTFSRNLDVYNHAYWLEAVYDAPFGLKLVPGLRIDRWDFEHTQGVSVQPRMTARYEFLDGMTAKAAWGIYEKLPEPNYLIDSPLGNPRLDPLRSIHYIVGYEHELTDLINVDLQLFYNQRRRIPSPSRSVTFEDGQSIPEVWASDGGGRTYGLELLLRHLATETGNYYGWVAYTLSRSIRWDRRPDATYAIQSGRDFNELAYNERASEEYLSPFDQTHILTIVAQAVLPWGFEAGCRLRLVSGNPTTPLGKGETYFDADSDRYGLDVSDVPRNSGRLPTFVQLDVRIDKTWTFDLWKLTAYLEVLNATNNDNVEQYSYDYRFEERAALTFLPIIPILGVRGEF